MSWMGGEKKDSIPCHSVKQSIIYPSNPLSLSQFPEIKNNHKGLARWSGPQAQHSTKTGEVLIRRFEFLVPTTHYHMPMNVFER